MCYDKSSMPKLTQRRSFKAQSGRNKTNTASSNQLNLSQMTPQTGSYNPPAAKPFFVGEDSGAPFKSHLSSKTSAKVRRVYNGNFNGPADRQQFQTVLNSMEYNTDVVYDNTEENLQQMAAGYPPTGRDGLPVNIHHIGQENEGGRLATTQTRHQQDRSLHHNTGREPSKINRNAFSKEKKALFQLMPYMTNWKRNSGE